MNAIVEAWRIHDRINLYLLNAVNEEEIGFVSSSKGRTCGEQFAHIHNVRLMWLKSADAALMAGLEKLEKDGLTKKRLSEALTESGVAVEKLLGNALAGDGKVKGFKPNATAFFAYLVSHESHHRGQICLTMKQGGRALDKKVLFGIWEWGTR